MIASLILALHLLGYITLTNTISSLYIAGALLIIAELGVVSFGVIAFNGLLALYAGYALQQGTDILFGIPVGWDVLFGIAAVELFIVITVISIHTWLRNIGASTGTEGMIGEKAIITNWDGKKGSVRYEGEIWKAVSKHEIELGPDEEVIIDAVNKLELTIRA